MPAIGQKVRASKPPVEITMQTLGKWKTLRGTTMSKQLDFEVKGQKIDAQGLRGLMLNLKMLDVSSKEPGYLKWLDGKAPAVFKKATVSERQDLKEQMLISGFPPASVESWSKTSWLDKK